MHINKARHHGTRTAINNHIADRGFTEAFFHSDNVGAINDHSHILLRCIGGAVNQGAGID